MKSKSTLMISALCAALALAGCGGGDDGGSADNGGDNGGNDGGNNGGDNGGGTPTSQFTQKDGNWTFTLPASGTSLCYDFDTESEVAGCTGSNWDLKITSSGATATLWTNSGVSGPGRGGAFGGPFDHTWTELQSYQSATVDPESGETLPSAVYTADTAASVFTGTNDIQSAAFEYDLTGDHRLYPNFRVFLITTDSSATTLGAGVYALQITGYYGGPGGATSGYPSFRWVEQTGGATVQEASVNATGGWVYYDLANKQEVGEDGPWQIAFNRYNVKLNGGTSGSGTVAGFVSKTPAGFYDADNKPIVAKFTSTTNLSDTLPDLTGTQTGPARASAWVKDSTASILNPAAQGSYPNPLDYGWYKYYPTAEAAGAAGLGSVAHVIAPNPDNGTLIRSGEGNSYARIHLTGITYADPTNASSAQTWKFEYDVQPE
ncbi:hypothetical protein GCM10023144_14870 [Pigmentiphaga soli]|uniref:Heme-binding HmuY-like protein n=1 Tax=Pigmentiphaga soli TaxID=1007095 RepID=A0ABP8GR68_9BURK